jgi:glutamate 5-kinase
MGVVPIVNENDTVSVSVRFCRLWPLNTILMVILGDQIRR